MGTVLIFLIPTSIKITYGLTAQSEDGETIVFNVFEPKKEEIGRKAIILGHGIMDSKEWMKSYAIEFAAAGFIAVTLDFRGHGMSSGELNWSRLIYDVKAIITYLNSRGDIDMNNLGYLGFSMGGWPGNQIVKNNSAFKCFIGVGTFLNITKAETQNRTLNILMIQAKFDEVFTLEGTKEAMGKRLNMTPEDIVVNRLYGSFQTGNASMIYLDDDADHVSLAWDQDVIREARDWLLNTFPDVMPVDSNFYVNIRAVIFFLQLFSGLFLFYFIITPLSNVLIKNPDEPPNIDFPNESIKRIMIKTLFYSLILGIPGMLMMIPILFLSPLPLASAMVMFL
ncbi:MAG: alpha/beta hydrolase, partial [Candidatus Helarchaeota archaeon]